MTVRLEAISMSPPIGGKPHRLFQGLDIDIPSGGRIGILGLPRSGKTTLLNIIAGTETSFTGNRYCDGRCSWIIPYDGFIANTAPMAWSIRFLGRLYGVRDNGFARRVGKIAAAGEFVNQRATAIPGYVRQQIAFAVGIAMDFDVYLFDNMAVPQRGDYREIGKEFLASETAGKTIVVATNSPPQVTTNCESAYVLEDGRAIWFADVNEAAKYFKEMTKAEEERQKQLEQQGVTEDDLAEDSVAGPTDVDMIGAAISSL